jgi:hypothetical protein
MSEKKEKLEKSNNEIGWYFLSGIGDFESNINGRVCDSFVFNFVCKKRKESTTEIEEKKKEEV